MTLDVATASPVDAASRDAASRMEELGRIILAYSDVTDKLQQSQEQLRQTVQSLRNDLAEKDRQLERKNRLAALGEMAAGMAHEIRNPLGGIQLYASLLAKDVADRPPSLQLVNKITSGVKRLEWLVSQVLQFTREIRATPAPTDLAEVIEHTLELAAAAIEAKRIACDLGGPRPAPARLDGLLFGQALLNLVLNAIDAMSPGGRLTIRWDVGRGPSGEPRASCLVRDDGPGIPPDVVDRIFNPFFTTKDTGTGLGLAIVHRIVEAHDGTIAVRNDPGGGAAFEIEV